MTLDFEENDLVEVVNAVNPAYHEVGDILPVWRVKKEERMLILPDDSGGSTPYSFDDVILSHKKINAPEKIIISESEHLLKSKNLLSRINQISMKHCSDYPSIESCGELEKLYAIESTLEGIQEANKDVHTVIEKLRKKIGMSLEEYVLFLEQ
jgi:hypothetical protein